MPEHPANSSSAIRMTRDNIDRALHIPMNMSLTIGKPDYALCDGRFGVEEMESMNTRLKLGYFYHEGPEFRADYIHERVEY